MSRRFNYLIANNCNTVAVFSRFSKRLAARNRQTGCSLETDSKRGNGAIGSIFRSDRVQSLRAAIRGVREHVCPRDMT